MIAHISIGVSDIGKSKRFYDAALEPLGYRCVRAARAATGYGYGAETIAFWVLFAEHPVAPDEQSASMSVLPHRAQQPSTRFMQPHCAPAAVTMAGRVCGQNTLRITTLHSWSIPTDIESRPISVREKRKGRTADAPVYIYYAQIGQLPKAMRT
jgi:hypothetical protein